jgi:hypothetical protein
MAPDRGGKAQRRRRNHSYYRPECRHLRQWGFSPGGNRWIRYLFSPRERLLRPYRWPTAADQMAAAAALAVDLGKAPFGRSHRYRWGTVRENLFFEPYSVLAERLRRRRQLEHRLRVLAKPLHLRLKQWEESEWHHRLLTEVYPPTLSLQRLPRWPSCRRRRPPAPFGPYRHRCAFRASRRLALRLLGKVQRIQLERRVHTEVFIAENLTTLPPQEVEAMRRWHPQ